MMLRSTKLAEIFRLLCVGWVCKADSHPLDGALGALIVSAPLSVFC